MIDSIRTAYCSGWTNVYAVTSGNPSHNNSDNNNIHNNIDVALHT
jgi:hypothetical protein